MKRISIVLSGAALLLWACNSETKDSVEKADSTNMSKMDSPSVSQPIMADEETSSFFVKAANAGMTEVQIGEMAQQKATHDNVKSFAAMLIHDHTAVNEEAKSLAAQRNVSLPAAISEENQKDMDDLAGKKVKDFDKAYINEMIKRHNASIELFEKSGDKINDTEVKTFINNTLPKIRMHLDSAKVILKTLK